MSYTSERVWYPCYYMRLITVLVRVIPELWDLNYWMFMSIIISFRNGCLDFVEEAVTSLLYAWCNKHTTNYLEQRDTISQIIS